MNVYNLSESQINAELLARGSRTSGTREQKQDRLQRFLDFENQKERRNRYVQEKREALNNARIENEMDGQQDQDQDQDECCETCECNNQVQTEEERAARILLDLRDDADRSQYYLNQLIPRMKAVEQAFADLDESYEVVVAENLRLNTRLNNLETRLSHIENRRDSPPLPPMFPESNPMWKLEEFHQY
jgi:hypothetical protein